MFTATIVGIVRSFIRAHREAVYARQGNYKKSHEVMEREYEVHP